MNPATNSTISNGTSHTATPLLDFVPTGPPVDDLCCLLTDPHASPEPGCHYCV
jgi:hypothetical protein